jgi:hypothetical protein
MAEMNYSELSLSLSRDSRPHHRLPTLENYTLQLHSGGAFSFSNDLMINAALAGAIARKGGLALVESNS